MFSVPATIGLGAVPGGTVVFDAGFSLLTVLLVAVLALACGIAVRVAVEARLPRIEVRSPAAARDLRRVA